MTAPFAPFHDLLDPDRALAILREAVAGARAGARLLFVSPVHSTRSHPDARALGSARAAAIGRGLGPGLIALGGMTAKRFRAARTLGFHGWAAIDALTAQDGSSFSTTRLAQARPA